uniref:Uncharacterized protein n=1 Tax=Micrurus lemniscatus lemniscatus TaxID=129467 RepID=A0A2D4J801_MICLE
MRTPETRSLASRCTHVHRKVALPVSSAPAFLAHMCRQRPAVPEPRKATGDGWRAQRDGSACHFRHACHKVRHASSTSTEKIALQASCDHFQTPLSHPGIAQLILACQTIKTFLIRIPSFST